MVLLLMVMPRSRSMSIESRIWSRKSRSSTPPVRWINRSARVDFPWSMWAMMQKLRMSSKTEFPSAAQRVPCEILQRLEGGGRFRLRGPAPGLHLFQQLLPLGVELFLRDQALVEQALQLPELLGHRAGRGR